MLKPEEHSKKPAKEIDGKWVILLFAILLALTGILAKFAM